VDHSGFVPDVNTAGLFGINDWLEGGKRMKDDLRLDDSATGQKAQGASGAGPYFAGIDSGSATTNVVVIDANKNIVGMATAITGAKVDASAKAALAAALKQKKIMPYNVKYIIATGYGRNALRWPDSDVTEITCHAKGAHHQFPNARTVIDIGGQDSKIIQMDDDGNVVDFMMNDKCAAGTGRFLEMMAKTLGMTIQEFAKAGLQWKEDIAISSTCAVFAESEVASLIEKGKPAVDIIHGLNGSVANRVVNMIARQGADGAYVMTGGVAKNDGVVGTLSERLKEEVLKPKFPEMCGALGAALLAAESVKK